MILSDIQVVCLYGEEVIKMNEYIEYLWKEEKPKFNLQGIKDIEKQYLILFPQDFLYFFKDNFGNKSVTNLLSMEKGNDIVSHFLHVQNLPPSDKRYIYSIKYQIEEFEGNISEKIIPFMITKTSNLVCFDFRRSDSVPEVVLVLSDRIEDGESKSVKFVAKCFSSFLRKLESSD